MRKAFYDMNKEQMHYPAALAEKPETALHHGFDQQKLYDLLLTIPCGRVVTYGKLAEMLGSKNLARAVGKYRSASYRITHSAVP